MNSLKLSNTPFSFTIIVRMYLDLCLYTLSGDEDERRQMVLVDVCGEIVINRQKALNFVLIMGDVSGQMDFIRTIRLLRSRGYCNVFLVQEPPNGSGDLGSTDWLRAGLSLRKPYHSKPNLCWHYG